jgi:hypothetical protein
VVGGKGLSILTVYKSPREWNEPCVWHEINLAHKFPVKTDVPEPCRKVQRPKSKVHLSPSSTTSAWALCEHGAFGPLYDATMSMTPTFHISMNRYFLQDYNGVSLILSLSFERELFPKIEQHSDFVTICITQHHEPFITWMSNNRRQVHYQSFPLLMENQKKVQSVESVNDYRVTLCIQGIPQTSCAFLFCDSSLILHL